LRPAALIYIDGFTDTTLKYTGIYTYTIYISTLLKDTILESSHAFDIFCIGCEVTLRALCPDPSPFMFVGWAR
jgi:hypothetical protein